MKYCVLVIDGAADWALPERQNKSCLELAHTPHLDTMANEGLVGTVRTVPSGMEPSSACACMSVLGYDPRIYYKGRSGIEARSMGVPVSDNEVIFRCNLVGVQDGEMRSYSCGHIPTEEARVLVATLNEQLGTSGIQFYPGVSYRHLCKISGHPEALNAVCTPPHDIPNKPIAEYLPQGEGSEILRDLMDRSIPLLEGHPINIARQQRNDIPATMIWLFWGSGRIPEMPSFHTVYGITSAMTSGVDLLRGLARMIDMEVLEIAGVTDGLDNDYAAQAEGALRALEKYDLVCIHVEAPDEAAHAGSIDEKIKAIERVDQEVVSRICLSVKESIRVLVLPDHPTPIQIQTHTDEPVPFILWGAAIASNGAKRFTETEAEARSLFIEEGHNIMSMLVKLA